MLGLHYQNLVEASKKVLKYEKFIIGYKFYTYHKEKENQKNKAKEFKFGNFNRKLNMHKRHLNRLWAMRLFHFLKAKSKKQYAFKKINSLKNQMISASNIHQLSKVFEQNPWISQMLEKQKQQFLTFINDQKISDQTKLILFQTFDILLEGTKYPESFVSWNLQSTRNIKESKQLLIKFQDKTFQEIYKLALIQYQRYKDHYKNNKCSPYNNISYFWFKYVKEIFQSEEFKQIYHTGQIHERLQFIFSQSPNISNIKNLLSIKQFAQYILNTKIESKKILSQLVLNSKSNLLNKINMIISLNQFIKAVKDPSTLHGWIG